MDHIIREQPSPKKPSQPRSLYVVALLLFGVFVAGYFNTQFADLIGPPIVLLFFAASIVLVFWRVYSRLKTVEKLTAGAGLMKKHLPTALILLGAILLVVGFMSFNPGGSDRDLFGRYSSAGWFYPLSAKITASFGVVALASGLLLRKRN